MATLTVRLTPALAGAFAQMLEEEGLDVTWDRPMEQRSAGSAELVQGAYQLGIGVGGAFAYDSIKTAARAAAQKFRERWPKAPMDDDPPVDLTRYFSSAPTAVALRHT